MNEFTSETDMEIRRRGHFTIYDDGSCESFLSYMLINQDAKGRKNA